MQHKKELLIEFNQLPRSTRTHAHVFLSSIYREHRIKHTNTHTNIRDIHIINYYIIDYKHAIDLFIIYVHALHSVINIILYTLYIEKIGINF